MAHASCPSTWEVEAGTVSQVSLVYRVSSRAGRKDGREGGRARERERERERESERERERRKVVPALSENWDERESF